MPNTTINNNELTKIYDEMIANKQITDMLIFLCLLVCEYVINQNAYLDVKWSGGYWVDLQRNTTYHHERLRWTEYRTKLQAVLVEKYPMNKVIQFIKSPKSKKCKYKYAITQKMVTDVVALIDSGDYVWASDDVIGSVDDWFSSQKEIDKKEKIIWGAKC